jgi:hypothetical protein
LAKSLGDLARKAGRIIRQSRRGEGIRFIDPKNGNVLRPQKPDAALTTIASS